MADRLRVLIVTTLFPSNVNPGYAPFNRQQFAPLGRMADVDVLGVVPWRFGNYSAARSSRDVVVEERIADLLVRHPRYPSIPGLPSLNVLAPLLLPIGASLGLSGVHYALVLIIAMGVGGFMPLAGVGFYVCCAVMRRLVCRKTGSVKDIA